MLLFLNNLNWDMQIHHMNWVTMCVSSIGKSYLKIVYLLKKNTEIKSALCA